MRIVRHFFPAFVLAITLAVSTSAGVMSTPDDPPPPGSTPATSEGEMSTSLNGTMHTGDSEATADDVLAEAALRLVQVVLSLL
jgi:hypothetical protein